MKRGLAYEAMPPLSVPMRFFLTAPLFGIAAGLLLLTDDAVLVSRWTPGALAAVHLITVGFMLHVMLGALMQILPVVAGASFSAPLHVAAFTHVAVSAGAISLSWGLGRSQPDAIVTGAVLLGIGLVVFLCAAAVALRRAPDVKGSSRTPRDLRLALVGLTVTTVLGLLLAFILARGFTVPIPLPTLVNLHAGWGWMGWGGLLLAATSWVVVPMFQITPSYPARFTVAWSPVVLAMLLLWTAAMVIGLDLAIVVALALLVLAGAYAGMTLRLQSQSRRAIPDAPSRTFRLAMLAIIGGLATLLVSLGSEAPYWPVLAGVLILHGGFGSAISAMLYKIVPFLTWLHLTQAGVRVPPNMKKLLPDTRIRIQLRLHGAVLAILVVAVFLPQAGRVAGVVMLLEFGWLLANLLGVLHAWRRATQA